MGSEREGREGLQEALERFSRHHGVAFGDAEIVWAGVPTRSGGYALSGGTGGPIDLTLRPARAIGVFAGVPDRVGAPWVYLEAGGRTVGGNAWSHTDRLQLPHDSGGAIRFCLRVRAPENAYISWARIYSAWGPSPLIDDLTYVPVAGEEVRNERSEITFLYPTEVTRVTHYRPQFAFIVRDDWGIASVDVAMPPGPYTVEPLDGAGNVLAQRTFRPTSFSKGDHDSDSGSFFLTLPVIEEARTIRFLYQGREIGRLAASAGAPTVEIIEPRGDADWSGDAVRTVRWRAQDPDGDPLRFTVQASEDGERWLTLALELKGRDSFDVSVSDLAGGSYYLRVLATDGFHSAEARTAGRVTVGRKPPRVSIASPADGDSFGVGHEVILQAFAADLEDGTVPDSAYRWTSSIDGELGTGPSLWALPLSPGEHVITVRVTDRDGMYGEASVRITIAGEPPVTGLEDSVEVVPARAPQGSGFPSLPMWAWAVAAAVLLAAAAAGWRYRRLIPALRRPPSGGTES